MQHAVRIHTKNGVEEVKAEAGTNLLEFLRRNSIGVSAPCGGNGKCGKCRVLVEGLSENPSDKERNLLGDKALAKGFRLACYNHIHSDLDIYLSGLKEEASIVTTGKERKVKLDPIITKKFVELSIPDIHDQSSDIDRVAMLLKKVKNINSLDLIRTLPDTIRSSDYRVTLVQIDNKLIAIEPGNTTDEMYGIAVDIGTTTIAAYLYNLADGSKMDVYSMLNPQRRFGADVLSRIEYTLDSKKAANEMNKTIVECINRMIGRLAKANRIKRSGIYTVVFVGNTTMMHFLMNVTARNIAVSPFIPATTRLHKFRAKELGININRYGYVIIYPSVSGYIGADIVAGVLSSGLYMDDRISLLIDIGTNGEMVLGNSKWMYSCSTAAGPAFEGANIRNGVGGIKGAIDTVRFNEKLELTTIGGESAVGLCGSGIVDAVAVMLKNGIIDETGRIAGEDEMASVPEILRPRITEVDGLKAFLLLKVEETAVDTDIAITQKDIRELQNAKAAIAAGIKTLVKRAGISFSDIDRVYLAGGFGSYIDIDSALTIGLLPSQLKGRIESIGNSAGSGAVEGLLNEGMLKESEKIRDRIKYVELSASPDFVDEYVQNMLFETE